MKKLIKRFREWLIVKLGGYTTPFSTIKHHTLNPIRVSSTVEVYRDEAISEECLIECLVSKLALEIEKNNLFDVCQCVNYQHDTIVYKMSVLVVDPKECD